MQYMPLQVTGGTVSATAPPDATVAPAGDYMLFVLTTANVPSVATMIRMNGTYTYPPTPPTILTTLNSGQALQQSVLLQSTNQQYFAVAQPDGSFVIYNSLLYKNEGAIPTSAVFSAGTGGTGTAPYTLNMLVVRRNPMCLKSANVVVLQRYARGGQGQSCNAKLLMNHGAEVMDQPYDVQQALAC